jgi:hypothetical protein
MEERGAECATEMGSALAPVETGIGEAAAPGSGLVEVEPEIWWGIFCRTRGQTTSRGG